MIKDLRFEEMIPYLRQGFIGYSPTHEAYYRINRNLLEYSYLQDEDRAWSSHGYYGYINIVEDWDYAILSKDIIEIGLPTKTYEINALIGIY